MGDVLARPWRSFLQSRFYRLVDVWGTEATEGATPIVARTPSAGAFSADGKRLLVGMDGEWEQRERVKLFSPPNAVPGSVFAPPGRLIALDLATGEELDRLDFASSGDGIGAAAFGPDGRLYCGGTLGRIYVFAPAT